MLSTRADSFRKKSKLAISLSWIGGYTNVVTLLTCGWVSSHMTGPTTWFGRAIVEGGAPVGPTSRGVWFFGWVIFAFWLGACASALMIEAADRRGSARKYVLPMAVEAILLSIFAIGVNLHSHGGEITRTCPLYLLIGAACFAMGLQNATITRISGAVVRTTHVTGVVTDLGIETGHYFYGMFGRHDPERRHATRQRLLLLAAIFGSFLFGVVAGTYVCLHSYRKAMLLPIGFLALIVLTNYFRTMRR